MKHAQNLILNSKSKLLHAQTMTLNKDSLN